MGHAKSTKMLKPIQQKLFTPFDDSPLKLKKVPNLTKTLLEHNEEVVLELRNKVIKEIETDNPISAVQQQ